MGKQPLPDAERRAAQLDRTLEKADAEIAKTVAKTLALQKMRNQIAAQKETRDARESPDFDAAMLRSAQLAYLRKKRKDFKMPRKFDTTIDPPMEWTVSKTIYDLRSKDQGQEACARRRGRLRPSHEKDGRKKQQVVEYLLILSAREDLLRLRGGKGRANRLSVIPAQYPVAVKNDGNFWYTGQKIT